MKVLVCGGRNYNDYERIKSALDSAHVMDHGQITQIIHGDARGADRLGGAWATEHGIPIRKFPADWARWGKAAGAKRNEQMLVQGKPDLVIAFPGGIGTAHMIRIAKAAGVEVKEITA